MAPQPGRRAVVRVPVATLWTAPEAVRPVDCPALAGSPNVAAWVAAYVDEHHVERQFLKRARDKSGPDPRKVPGQRRGPTPGGGA